MNKNSHTSIPGIGMTSQRTRSRLIHRLREKGIVDKSVLSVMEKVPRHLFVDEALAHRAYEDTALPIGMKQTISQPYIVARMTELLVMSGSMQNVLEIGTGCGYQTAILAGVSKWVYSIERIEALKKKAAQQFKLLNLYNVALRHGDGYLGWSEEAPFDAIMVTAAADQLPEQLLQQLADGGRMVLPVTQANGEQQLQLIEKNQGEISVMSVESVRFVPLLGGAIK